jgi:hypothetical protein
LLLVVAQEAVMGLEFNKLVAVAVQVDYLLVTRASH